MTTNPAEKSVRKGVECCEAHDKKECRYCGMFPFKEHDCPIPSEKPSWEENHKEQSEWEEAKGRLRYLVEQYCRARGKTTKDPSEADYRYFDELLDDMLSSTRTQAFEEGVDAAERCVEERMKNVPASVQCRVAIDCVYCAGRTDVSYHDALADTLEALRTLKKGDLPDAH